MTAGEEGDAEGTMMENFKSETILPSTVAIIGLGFVGLHSARLAVRAGHRVVGVDHDSEKVARLVEGVEPTGIFAGDQLSKALSSGSFSPTSSFSKVPECEVVVVCLPTPLDLKGNPSYSALSAGAKALSSHVKYGAMIILQSTVGIGYTRGDFARNLGISEGRARGLRIAFSPERFSPGRRGLNETVAPKIVGGLDTQSLLDATEFMSSLHKLVFPVSSAEIAEAAKLLENSFRFVNIAFINEIASALDRSGLNPIEVLDAAETKGFGFMRFNPGAGIGGHCIPVDYAFLQESLFEQGTRSRIIESASLAENEHFERNLAKVSDAVKRLSGRGPVRIVVAGMSYKPDVPDFRSSPGLRLYREFEKSLNVAAFDPNWKIGPADIAWVTELTPLGATNGPTVLVKVQCLDNDLLLRVGLGGATEVVDLTFSGSRIHAD